MRLKPALSDLWCACWALPQIWRAYRTQDPGERNRKLNWIAAKLKNKGRLRRISRPGIDGKLVDYLDRYFIVRWSRFGIFLHRFWSSDAPTFHCHPWNNASLILTGCYIEHYLGAPEDTQQRHRGSFRWRQAEVLHWLQLELPADANPTAMTPVWTLFFRGRRSRKWGFYDQVGPFTQAKIQGSKREY